MAKVKTAPVTAQYFDNFDELRVSGNFRKGSTPGGIHISAPESDGEQYLTYCCPCGCGRMFPLVVGNGFKPDAPHATWQWNGSREKPTLSPSIYHVGHWHGWLTDGVWRSC